MKHSISRRLAIYTGIVFVLNLAPLSAQRAATPDERAPRRSTGSRPGRRRSSWSAYSLRAAADSRLLRQPRDGSGTSQRRLRRRAPAASDPPATPAPLPPLQSLNNQTVRMILRTSIGGRRARVKLTNAFNGTPVEIGAAHIALRDKDSGIVTHLGSRPDVQWPAIYQNRHRVSWWSAIRSTSTIAPLTDLAVTLYLPGDTGAPTTHATGLRPTYISREGNFAGSQTIPDATTRLSYYWLASDRGRRARRHAADCGVRRLHHRRRPLNTGHA